MLGYLKDFMTKESWLRWFVTLVPSFIVGVLVGFVAEFIGGDKMGVDIVSVVSGAIATLLSVYCYKLQANVYLRRDKPQLMKSIKSLSWARDIKLILVYFAISSVSGIAVTTVLTYLFMYYFGVTGNLSFTWQGIAAALGVILLVTVVMGVLINYLLIPYTSRLVVAGVDSGLSEVRNLEEVKNLVKHRIGRDEKISIVWFNIKILISVMILLGLVVAMIVCIDMLVDESILLFIASSVSTLLLIMLLPVINYMQYRIYVDTLKLNEFE